MTLGITWRSMSIAEMGTSTATKNASITPRAVRPNRASMAAASPAATTATIAFRALIAFFPCTRATIEGRGGRHGGGTEGPNAIVAGPIDLWQKAHTMTY